MPVSGDNLRMMITRRLSQLLLGLGLYGLSIALMVRAGLGLAPWDVLNQGLSGQLGWSFGMVIVAIGALVLLLWIPLRQKPGIGTVGNILLIGPSTDLALSLLPTPDALWLRGLMLAGGVVLCGLATGAYIGAGLGPGPRDGLMTGVVRRTGWSVRTVRTGIELTVLAAGWLLGGSAGLGTLAFALAIGPLAQTFLPLFTLRAAAPAAA